MEVTRKPHLHRDWIDPHAFGIVKALQKAGYTSYLVGGCVRDLLLGIHPKDFDIATMANPQQVKRQIYMSFIIGKRFRLVLVKRDEQQFEVATFRKEMKAEDFPEGELPFGDNVFGTPEEDAVRRDFTVNGLFYDPVGDQLIDHVGGLPDIETRTLRMIGDPEQRLLEDPIRILRGLRFAHKLGFTIEPKLRESMQRHAESLEKAVLPRRREEILKILRLERPELAILEAFDLGFLKYAAPTLDDLLRDNERRESFVQHFLLYRELVHDPSDPTSLFAWLVYAMLQAARSGPSTRETPIAIEDEVFQNCMRDEFGMFKLEQSLLSKAIEILPHFQQVEDFRRRGERRQNSFMRGEGFHLALRIAKADFLLSASDLDFWQSTYGRFLQLPEERSRIDSEDEGSRRPRRRGRRVRGNKRRAPSGGATAGEATAGGATSENAGAVNSSDLVESRADGVERP